jgi:hypothetical protein
MFAISREETLAALEHMEEENLKFYDAHCPKCRRANRVERIKLEFSYPGWRDAIRAMAKQAAQAEAEKPAPQPEAAPAPEPAAAAQHKKHSHKPAMPVAAQPVETSSPKGKTAAKAAAKPVTKKAAAKPAPKKTATKPAAKPAAKKPAVKKPAAPAKGKKTTGGAKKK